MSEERKIGNATKEENLKIKKTEGNRVNTPLVQQLKTQKKKTKIGQINSRNERKNSKMRKKCERVIEMTIHTHRSKSKRVVEI